MKLANGSNQRWIALLIIIACLGLRASAAQTNEGAAIYKRQCSLCHDNSAMTRAPAPAALKMMAPEAVLRALETGRMKDQGALLTAAQKRTIAEFVTGKQFGQEKQAQTTAPAGLCPATKAAFAMAANDWNGWSPNSDNARFQPADRAQLSADQVPRLKLKWAFAFPGAPMSWGQATIVGGRIFVPSYNRLVYSLDASTGCQYWTFEADIPARNSIMVAQLPGEPKKFAAFFGDQKANAYAIDAVTGQLLWKVHIDSHPRSKIVGSPAYFDGRVFFPLTGGEEVGLGDKYECCTSRGGIVALDAATGKQIWKTYSIAEEPHPTTKTAAGVQNWGPSGASIWSSPTVDVKKKVLYAGTGDNFSQPDTKTSDAVLAFDIETGKLLWSTQITEHDVFNIVCAGEGCGEHLGPDVDIGASPILINLPNGKRELLISQKSGMATAIDPDQEGKILWQTKVARGGRLGGIQWGSASDGQNMYAAVSDIAHTSMAGIGHMVADPKAGGGLVALKADTGEKVWTAPPGVCGDRPSCSPAQSAAISVIPGVVFSGAVDGRLRGYSTIDGKVIWEFDTAQEFAGVNGVKGKGGAMDGAGPTISGGMLFVGSGYGIWGGQPGNVLLAFSVDGK
ncbi:MAG TPA: PQQ-binding-like beta-propeller repeat protein [Candidatus Angelobacter sp.]|nr:PQQ-binding-like beta-propeller repeat protein [Candidatus Angelobacter sp.]